ncbi:MAG: DUF1573 domain-containing protein [Candidatus Omnitrophica bacterium]|nr:DUF1573 domain-containing protein [Candidatus Omnitrophota bacterium]
MKIKVLVLVGLFLLLAGFSYVYAEGVSCGAKEQESDTWDFGKVKEGQVVKHSFVFVNNTSKQLVITDVNTSCGCTVSEAKNKTLQPQEKTNIEVAFNSKGYKGAVQQFVFVATDNPEKSAVKFTIKAEVEK